MNSSTFVFPLTELPVVLVTEGSDPKPLAWLKERARVVEAAPDSPEFGAALPDAVHHPGGRGYVVPETSHLTVTHNARPGRIRRAVPEVMSFNKNA